MQSYKYRGRNASGKAVSGSLEAKSETAAADALMKQGIIPLEVRKGGSGAGSASLNISDLFQRSVPLDLLVIFCRQLYSLTKAGVPLLRSIRGLTQSSNHPLLKHALEDIATELANGRALSMAMREHPKVFSELFISLIAVGENTGRLEQSLEQLASYYEQEIETRRRIKTAMRYPTFVLSAIGIAMVVLNIKVIPQFASMFSRFGVDLPLPTKILIASSNFFVNYWHIMLGASVLGWVLFRNWRNTDKGKETWDRWRLRFPIVGAVVNRASYQGSRAHSR